MDSLLVKFLFYCSLRGKITVSASRYTRNRYCQYLFPYQKSGGWVVYRRSLTFKRKTIHGLKIFRKIHFLKNMKIVLQIPLYIAV